MLFCVYACWYVRLLCICMKKNIFNAAQMHAIVHKMHKNAENTGTMCLDTVEEHITGQRGLFFCSLSIRCNYKWPRAEGWGSQSDLGSHVNLRPTVSWLWQQDFTSIIQIPKQRQSALCTTLTSSGAVFTRRYTEKRGPEWMKTPPSRWITITLLIKHLEDAIVAIHWTVRHNTRRGPFLNDYANVI